MKNKNLFLLAYNPLSSKKISLFLEKKFGNSLTILTFTTGAQLLKALNSNTRIVILDYDLKEENTAQLLEKIKAINPDTQVIVLSSKEDMATSIDSYKKGARSFVPKNKEAFKRIQTIISNIIYCPVAIIKRFFGLKELLAIFIVEIMYIGVIVIIGFQIFK